MAKIAVEARLRAVIYVRISSDPSGAEKGVDRQEADCRALAASLGWDVVRVYRENDTSAYKQTTIDLPNGDRVRRVVRPMFREMLDLLGRREVDALIAYDLDRAVRDPRDLEDLIDAKVLAGFQVKSATASLRLDNDADIAMARIMVAFANKSSADTARRVARASKQRAAEGQWHGGRAPFGYRMMSSTLVQVPEQVAMLREATDRVLAGDSLYRVVRDWNEAGLSSVRGTKWSSTAIRQMLKNPAITGIRTYRPVQADGSLSKEVVLEAEGNWEAIMDRETFDRVGQVLNDRGSVNPMMGKNVPRVRIYPFSGMIRCGTCGYTMRKRMANYSCSMPERGTCHRQINFEQTNEIILAALTDAFSSATIRERMALTPNMGEQAKHAHRELSQDARRLTQLDDDHHDGTLDRATWLRQRSRIQERIAANQQLVEQVAPNLSGIDVEPENVISQWDRRPPRWQNQVARLLIDHVVIHAHPEGVGSTTKKRKGETVEEHALRHAQWRAEIMARRVEIVWAR